MPFAWRIQQKRAVWNPLNIPLWLSKTDLHGNPETFGFTIEKMKEFNNTDCERRTNQEVTVLQVCL